MTPYQYLKKCRMVSAAELLSKGIPVKNVTDMVGYASSKSFSSEFHRFYGASPRRFQHVTDQDSSQETAVR